MAKPHFYLRDKNAKKPTLIVLFYYIKRKRFAYSTKQFIHPREWSGKQQRVKNSSPDAERVNFMLDRLYTGVQDIYRKLLEESPDGTVTINAIRRGLDKFDDRVSIGETLLAYVRQLIERREQSPKFKKSTLGTYRSTLNQLEAFAKKEIGAGKDFAFQDITPTLLGKFEDFLIEQGITYNYAAKLLTNLRAILNQSRRDGVNKSELFRDFKPTVEQQTADSIYLSEQELQRIYQHDFSDNKRLEWARDLFIIGAFTGLRVSDFTQLNRNHLHTTGNGTEVLKVKTQKTEETVMIPLHPYVRAILEKYDWNLPSKSPQKLNDYLKEMGQAVGIDEQVSKSQKRAGKVQTEYLPKYKLISSHTARRSFATNAYKSGIPAPSIMKITGHRSEKAFMKYIKIGKEENAELMAENLFFKLSPLRVAK